MKDILYMVYMKKFLKTIDIKKKKFLKAIDIKNKNFSRKSTVYQLPRKSGRYHNFGAFLLPGPGTAALSRKGL